MLTAGDGLSGIDISSAILMSNNMDYMPMVLGEGIFGQVQFLPYEWAVSNVAVVNYTMYTNTHMKGADAVTDATVVPNVKAMFSMKSVIVGRIEANILYHRRPNTNIESNLGTMHADMVLDAYLEWTKEQMKRIDYSLINGYKDTKYVTLGIRGMRNFATEINAPTIDPTNYGECYSFFATQIDILVSELGVSPSRIRVLIGKDVVQAMQMTPLIGTTESVWQLLKQTILQDVLLKVAPKGVHDNQCSFVALDFVAPVSVANTNFTNLGEEKDAAGNHQYVAYIDCLLPSMIVSNDKACRHQSEMIASTKMLPVPTAPQTISGITAGNAKKSANKPVDMDKTGIKPDAEL